MSKGRNRRARQKFKTDISSASTDPDPKKSVEEPPVEADDKNGDDVFNYLHSTTRSDGSSYIRVSPDYDPISLDEEQTADRATIDIETGEISSENFQITFQKFVESMFGVIQFSRLSSETIDSAALKEVKKDYDEFVLNMPIVNGDSKNNIRKMNNSDFQKFSVLRRRLNSARAFSRDIRSGSLISAISAVEMLLVQLMKLVGVKKPEVLISSEKTITYKELLSYSTIEEAKDEHVRASVEALFFKSFDEQLNWFEKRLGISYEGLGRSLHIVKEAYERRNAILHNGGYAGTRYIGNDSVVHLRKEGTLREEMSVGDDICPQVSETRFVSISLLSFGIFICGKIWIKFASAESDRAIGMVNDMALDLMRMGASEEAAAIFSEFRKDVPASNALQAANLKINHANAQRISGNEDWEETIGTMGEWSAASELCQLGVACIHQEIDEAVRLMVRLVGEGKVDQHAIRYWPIFWGIKENGEFLRAYESLFNEEFRAEEGPLVEFVVP